MGRMALVLGVRKTRGWIREKLSICAQIRDPP
jgi:hypothetical protein